MKIESHLLALCLFQANLWGTIAFSTVRTPKALFPNVALKSTSQDKATGQAPSSLSSGPLKPQTTTQPDLVWEGAGWRLAEGLQEKIIEPPRMLAGDDTLEMFPLYPIFEKVEGGGTVRTYPMPPWAERCQYFLRTNGRPLKAKVNLWLGPIRTTHTNEITIEDGSLTPYSATLKFKKMSQVLKISTTESPELPIWAGVIVPSPARAKILAANTDKLWESTIKDQKKVIQGGSVTGGGGAIRYWTIPEEVEAVQVIGWSKDVSKKSFRTKIEVLQGPDNKKQEYMLQCGGGSQPYHAVIQTPGEGCVLWIRNLKFLEDGLFEFAVLPYEEIGDQYAAAMGDIGPY